MTLLGYAGTNGPPDLRCVRAGECPRYTLEEANAKLREELKRLDAERRAAQGLETEGFKGVPAIQRILFDGLVRRLVKEFKFNESTVSRRRCRCCWGTPG